MPDTVTIITMAVARFPVRSKSGIGDSGRSERQWRVIQISLKLSVGNHFKGQLLARRSYRGNLGETVDALLSTDARRLINHCAV